MNTNLPNRINLILFILTLFLSLTIKLDPPVWKGYSDAYDYLHQSNESFFSKDLYFPDKHKENYARPFTVPLIYKIASSDPETIIQIQKIFHALSTFFFCYVILLFFRSQRSKFIFIILWYLLMSWWNILGWTHTLLSESLSISFMFLWMASFLLFFYKRTVSHIIFHILITILFSFTRDTWPYVLVLFYGIFAIIAIKWERKLLGKIAVLLLLSCSIFVIQQKTAQIGKRYKLPIMNNIVFRVLPNEDYLNWFSDKGMPSVDKLKEQYSNLEDPKKIYSLYGDSAFSEFSDWVAKDGKTIYMKFLITHPSNLLLLNEKKEDLNRIFAYNIGYTGDVKGFSRISQFIFPIFNIITVLLLNVFLVFLFIKEKRLIWIFPTVILIIFTLNAILLYVADSMEVQRHLFITNIIIQFIGILLISFILDSDFCNNIVDKFKKNLVRIRRNRLKHFKTFSL